VKFFTNRSDDWNEELSEGASVLDEFNDELEDYWDNLEDYDDVDDVDFEDAHEMDIQ